MKKVRSFTLVEIMVTLVLGSLVILMAGSLYSTINRIHHTTVDQYEKNQELLTLYFILKEEFAASTEIHLNYDVLEFHHPDYSVRFIEFVGSEVLYTRDEYRDTIKIDCFDFENQSLKGMGNWVTYFSFTAGKDDNIMPLSFSKNYPSHIFITQNIEKNGL